MKIFIIHHPLRASYHTISFVYEFNIDEMNDLDMLLYSTISKWRFQNNLPERLLKKMSLYIINVLIFGITGQVEVIAEIINESGNKVYGLVRKSATGNTKNIDHLL